MATRSQIVEIIYKLCLVINFQFMVNGGEMVSYCRWGHIELAGNFLIGLPASIVLSHFKFST